MAGSFLFSPLNGGNGVSLSCNVSTSTSATLPALQGAMTALSVANTGVNYAYFAFGNKNIAATIASYVIAPGGPPVIISLQSGGGLLEPTTVAGISSGGVTTLQVSVGQTYS